MKNLNYLLLLTIIFLSIGMTLTAQERETRSVDDFHGIAVSASINAELVKGNKNELSIEVSGVELDDVETEVVNGILKLGMKSKNWSGNWLKKSKVTVIVTYTDDLDYISASSSADLVGKDIIKGEELEIVVSSSGDVILEVDVDELVATISSSADLDISGRANSAEVKASSSADFNGRKLIVQEADLSASSSADIVIHVDKALKARASSSADIEYYGSPQQKDVSKSSNGSVSGH